MRILVLDDDEDTVFVIKTALEAHGHEVVKSNDARCAIDMLRNSKFDVVITDVIVPPWGGDQFLHWVKVFADEPLPRIIVCTGLTGGEWDDVHAVIRKPFNLRDLYAAVES